LIQNLFIKSNFNTMFKYIVGGVILFFILLTTPVFATTLYNQPDFTSSQTVTWVNFDVIGSFQPLHSTILKAGSSQASFLVKGNNQNQGYSYFLSTTPNSNGIFAGFGQWNAPVDYSYIPAVLGYGNGSSLSTSSTYYILAFASGDTLHFGNDGTNVTGTIDDGRAPYYAKVKNTGGYINLREATSTSANIIKTLPEDWIIQVSTTTDSTGNFINNDGYRWYQVTDPTDDVSGWMAGESSDGTVQYLPFELNKQETFEASSTDYVATSSRPDLILDIVDHFYNDTNTTPSLYSSDDGSNDISTLKNRNFEEKIIWGIIAQESGIIDFDNEHVSSDYGHGIMQITFDSSYPNEWDNRGVGSFVQIPPCASVNSTFYTNCYGGTSPKYYQPYGGSGSVTYKQYTNTEQSVYANIKDGLQVLQSKYNNFYPISTSTVINGTTYTANEREIILTTEGYNGINCGYVNAVASTTENIDNYFPTATSSDITTLIQKMHTAGNEVICAQLHSPGDLSISNLNGNKIGIVNGKKLNNFPLALLDTNNKIIKILSPENNQNYSFEVEGTNSGTYGLDVTIKNGDKFTKFKAVDIAMLPGQIHSYSFEKEALGKGQNSITLKVDRNGDGIPERVIQSGMTLTGEVYNKEATKEELKAYEKGDVPNKIIDPLEKIGPEILLSEPRYKLEIPKPDPVYWEKMEKLINNLKRGNE
jgi:hypothetical protein